MTDKRNAMGIDEENLRSLLTEGEYRRKAAKRIDALGSQLDVPEKKMVLTRRFEQAAAAFAKNPGGNEWGNLLDLMCAIQVLRAVGS